MSRFTEELAGMHGEYWKKNAIEEIERFQKCADDGDILLDKNGGAFWKSSGNYLPSDCAEKLGYTDFIFSLTETIRAGREQTRKLIEEYRKHPRIPSEEERAEMRAAFGEGTVVVDVFSGMKFLV